MEAVILSLIDIFRRKFEEKRMALVDTKLYYIIISSLVILWLILYVYIFCFCFGVEKMNKNSNKLD